MLRTSRFLFVRLSCLLIAVYQTAATCPLIGEDEARAIAQSDEVRETLLPLFQSIEKAEVSRVTVELTAESMLNGEVVDSQKSTYQIASMKPNLFTVYLKEPEQRTRIYCDGKSLVTALAPDAFLRHSDPISMQQAVVEMPVPIGPYPEPILALSLAGVDPAESLLTAMKSVELVDRGKLRGQIPAIHIRAVQDDLVSWEFWVSREEQPKPLRLLVDLTAMLRGTNQVQMPEGFSYQLRFDFLTWRMSGEVDQKLFQYTPPKGAKEYESLDAYYESIAGVVGEHPLLGKAAPKFQVETLSGKKFSSDDLRDKVVVLDFWATWCAPCVTAIPIIKEVTDKFSEKGVVFYAVNVGETPELVTAFLDKQGWDLDVVVDLDTKISDAFVADAIPQTVVIGKTGVIESVHTGFVDAESLTRRLKDELEVLSVGGKIASAGEQGATDN